MNIVQVGIIGIVGVLLAVQLKQEKSEVAIYLIVGIGLFIFIGMTDVLKNIVDVIAEIKRMVAFETTYIDTLLKMLGITYLAEFSSGLCKDAGYQTIASQIEMFSKLTILVLSFPILLALLKTIREFLA